MRKSKKFLSVLLAVLMAMSSLTVGFYAIAAEAGTEESTEEVTAVSAVESAISDFYANKYHTLMFSTKEADAESKEKALAAFDDICSKIKALSDAEKLELNLSNYAFILGIAADQAGRDAGKTSTAAKVWGASAEGFAKVTEKIGALPADYQKALELAQALYVKVDGTLFNSSFDFSKKTAGYAHYEANIEKVKELSEAGICFANYLYPSGDAFYINCYNPTSSGSNLFSQLTGITFNYYQDKITSAKTPSAPRYSTYIDRKNVDGEYVYTWKAGKDAVAYKAAYDDYLADITANTVPAGQNAYKKLIEVFGAVYGKDFIDAAMGVYETGLKNFSGSVTSAEISAVLDKFDAIEGNAAAALSAITGNSTLNVASKNVYPEGLEFTAETSAEDVYNNQIQNDTKYVKELISDMRNVLSELQLEEFVAAVNAADLDNLDAETVEAIRALYATLPSAFQKKVDDDVFAKFTKIVMPAVSHDDFADDVAAFKPVPVNRAAIGGEVIWTKEGIQNATVGTWNKVLSVLELAGVEIDLSNGLNTVLNDNLYQDSIVEAIFDLYATLSHNATETGVGIVPTIGDVIKFLISSSKIAGYLAQPDNKYAGAIEKIKAITVTDEDKANDINDLDKLAAIDFTDADFGFKNGDKDGFIDALLAALRPITNLLSGDNSILGIAGVNLNMFASVDSQGVFNEGIYSMLLPLLEQLGLNDLPTPDDYEANYQTVRAVSKNLGYDELLRPVVDSLFKNIVQPIADVPINGLITVLPRLAYVVDTNMVDETVKAVIKSTGNTLAGLADGLDLSGDAINNMITGAAININVNDVTYSLKLKPIDWDIIADCATVSAVKSSTFTNDYTFLRTGEVDSCFTNIFYYVYNLIFADKSNNAAITALVGSALSGIAQSTVVNLLNALNTGNKYSSYAAFLKLMAKKGETPLPREKSDVQKKFTDLGNQVFYDEYVAYTSIYNSFIAGTNPPKYSLFSPTTAITRAMFVAILYRMDGSTYDNGANPHKTNPFTDVKTTAYYYNAACWALDNGITNQTTFKPNDNVTREQTARFLFAYAEATGNLGDEAYKNVDLTSYPDYKNVHGWAVEPLQWANYNDMITGTQQGYINPQGATQRIHATRILYGFGRVCDLGSSTYNN